MAAGGSNGLPSGQASSSNHIKHGDPSVTELTDMPKSVNVGTAAFDEEDVRPTDHRDSDRSSEESARKEVLYAAGVGLTEDDPNMPCLTVRMWVIGIGFCLLGSGVNTLYTFRIPSITLSQSAIQFLAYPIGKAWYLALPDWKFSIVGQEISLNPGPFNYKVRPSLTKVFPNHVVLNEFPGEHLDLHHGQFELSDQTQC